MTTIILNLHTSQVNYIDDDKETSNDFMLKHGVLSFHTSSRSPCYTLWSFTANLNKFIALAIAYKNNEPIDDLARLAVISYHTTMACYLSNPKCAAPNDIITID